MDSTSNSENVFAYNELCKKIAKAEPINPNKMGHFDKLKSNFQYYILRCTRNTWIFKSLVSISVICLVNGTIYYNYGPNHPCNLILWHYFMYKDKLTPEQLWKAKVLAEFRRSFYYNDEGPLIAERDKKVTSHLL
ncbi:hypothetical protein Mgra_00007814 [Meloidogyne graminicola]|uniref:Uncharacterized protein n=1 Tax=Meloidogyne graminicola TaxID=189291 RepID=A0A8S9ZHE5_9BILA|nr:hypothetical protein Mgra_00007814 [Meloidogyne graminicola]